MPTYLTGIFMFISGKPALLSSRKYSWMYMHLCVLPYTHCLVLHIRCSVLPASKDAALQEPFKSYYTHLIGLAHFGKGLVTPSMDSDTLVCAYRILKR